MNDGVQLPRWQSHKIVAADKIVEIYFSREPSQPNHTTDVWVLACGARISVSKALWGRGGAHPLGGYYVQYEDGYESWSPAATFEKGYTRLP